MTSTTVFRYAYCLLKDAEAEGDREHAEAKREEYAEVEQISLELIPDSSTRTSKYEQRDNQALRRRGSEGCQESLNYIRSLCF